MKRLNEDEAQRWNRFINEICFKDKSNLTMLQKATVLSFWYDAEMNSGGHSGYFDCYPDIKPDELIWALGEVGGTAYIKNFKEAILNGCDDYYLKTDDVFYSIKPSLTDILMEYVVAHSKELFTST